MKITKIKMLKWICDVTRLYRIRKDYVTGNLGETNIAGKIKKT